MEICRARDLVFDISQAHPYIPAPPTPPGVCHKATAASFRLRYHPFSGPSGLGRCDLTIDDTGKGDVGGVGAGHWTLGAKREFGLWLRTLFDVLFLDCARGVAA